MPVDKAIIPGASHNALGTESQPWEEIHVKGIKSSMLSEGSVEQLDRWARSRYNQILLPTYPWEAQAVSEPSVIEDGGILHMIYRGGWFVTALGYATSTDGYTWTKSGPNPIAQGGVNGIPAGNLQQPQHMKIGSTWYVYYSDQIYTGSLRVLSGNSLTNLSYAGVVLAPQAGVLAWNNQSIFVSGGTYHLIVEGWNGTYWQIHYATSSSPTGPFTLQNGGNPLTSLQVAPGGMYGGPYIYPSQINGVYQLWYHAAPIAGNVPTNIYHATSTDFINWSRGSAMPALEHLGRGEEFDQVADPHVLEFGGKTLMFYDADDNTGDGAATIALAEFPGPIESLLDEAPLIVTDGTPPNLQVINKQHLPEVMLPFNVRNNKNSPELLIAATNTSTGNAARARIGVYGATSAVDATPELKGFFDYIGPGNTLLIEPGVDLADSFQVAGNASRMVFWQGAGPTNFINNGLLSVTIGHPGASALSVRKQPALTSAIEATVMGGTANEVVLRTRGLTEPEGWDLQQDELATGDLFWCSRHLGVTTEILRLQRDTPRVRFNLAAIPVFANNAAAISGGLVAGNIYRTGGDPDPVCIVH